MTTPEQALTDAWGELQRQTGIAYGHTQLLNPDLDQPTIAYATAELHRATERVQAAITQLETL